MNTTLRLPIIALLLCAGITAEEAQYYAFDDDKTYIIHGPVGAIVPDSHIIISSSWRKGLTVTIDGTEFDEKALQTLDMRVSAVEPATSANEYAFNKPQVEKADFIAAVNVTYGVDGAAWLAACSNPSPVGFAYIELIDHTFDGPDWYEGVITAEDGLEYLGLLSIDNDVDADANQGPVKCATDFFTWVEERMGDSAAHFRNRVVESYFELAENDEVDPAQLAERIDDYREHMQREIGELGETVATVAKAYLSLPGIINAPYGIALACSDLSDGELSAALELIPLNRIPVGRVWRLLRGTDGTGAQFAVVSREIAEAAHQASHDIANTEPWKVVDSFIANPATRQGNRLTPAAVLICKFGFCFASGTLVSTPNGPVAIERIAEGDRLIAYNELLGEFCTARVSSTYSARAREIIDLEVDNGYGGQSEIISATPNHPFLVAGHEFLRWTDAGALKSGDILVTHAGRSRILSSKFRTTDESVYNLRLDKEYTYLVGTIAAVVHNKPCALDELEAYKANGRLLDLFQDHSPEVLQAWFVKVDGTIDAAVAEKFSDSIRRLVDAQHEWVPVNRLYNSIYKQGRTIDKALAVKLVRFMNAARIDTGKLWFNNRISKKTPNAPRGYNIASQPLGHPGISTYGKHGGAKFDQDWTNEFHNELNKAFEKTLGEGNGTFDPEIWKANVDAFLPSYFSDNPVDGNVLENVRESLNAAVANWDSL